MNLPENPDLASLLADQERRLGFARKITEILQGQVPDSQTVGMIREANWSGLIGKDETANIKYMGLYTRQSIQLATVINQGGAEEKTIEVTYEREDKLSPEDSPIIVSSFETLVAQSGLEKRRAVLKQSEEKLLSDTLKALEDNLSHSDIMFDRRRHQ